jgi:hypothetical protein
MLNPGDTLVLEVLTGETYVAVVTRRSEYVRGTASYSCRIAGFPLSLAVISSAQGRFFATIYLTERRQYFQIAFSAMDGGYFLTELDPASFNRINEPEQRAPRSGTTTPGGRRR